MQPYVFERSVKSDQSLALIHDHRDKVALWVFCPRDGRTPACAFTRLGMKHLSILLLCNISPPGAKC